MELNSPLAFFQKLTSPFATAAIPCPSFFKGSTCHSRTARIACASADWSMPLINVTPQTDPLSVIPAISRTVPANFSSVVGCGGTAGVRDALATSSGDGRGHGVLSSATAQIRSPMRSTSSKQTRFIARIILPRLLLLWYRFLLKHLDNAQNPTLPLKACNRLVTSFELPKTLCVVALRLPSTYVWALLNNKN